MPLFYKARRGKREMADVQIGETLTVDHAIYDITGDSRDSTIIPKYFVYGSGNNDVIEEGEMAARIGTMAGRGAYTTDITITNSLYSVGEHYVVWGSGVATSIERVEPIIDFRVINSSIDHVHEITVQTSGVVEGPVTIQGTLNTLDDLNNTSAGDVWDDAKASTRTVTGFETIAAGQIQIECNDALVAYKSAVGVAAETDVYYADINYTKDGLTDEYTVSWFKNGQPVFQSTITGNVVFTVLNRTDGLAKVSPSIMTVIGLTSVYKYNSTSQLLDVGESYIAVCAATIDGISKTSIKLISRDG